MVGGGEGEHQHGVLCGGGERGGGGVVAGEGHCRRACGLRPCVGQAGGVGGVGVGGGAGEGDRGVVLDGLVGAGFGGGRLVLVGDGDEEVFGVGAGAVADLRGDLVGAVAARVGGVFEVGGLGK